MTLDDWYYSLTINDLERIAAANDWELDDERERALNLVLRTEP